MIDKKKFRDFNKIIVCVFGILLLLMVIRLTYSRFVTNGTGDASGDIAFYVINPGEYTNNLKMFNVKPDDKDYTYEINVSNYDDNGVSEVDLEYTLQLITTTNIPVSYKIYLNGETINDFDSKELITDDDGMYFYKFSSNSQTFEKNVKKSNTYSLVVNFPSSYNDELYQDLLDNVEVVVNARQV